MVALAGVPNQGQARSAGDASHRVSQLMQSAADQNAAGKVRSYADISVNCSTVGGQGTEGSGLCVPMTKLLCPFNVVVFGSAFTELVSASDVSWLASNARKVE